GAFVDVGVHQDGLVHVSQLADRFIKDPNDAVKVGQKVKVTVLSVDLDRNRIALSMKTQPAPGGESGAAQGRRQEQGGGKDGRGGKGQKGRGGGERRREEKPAAVPTKGTVAPNGIRFS